jgi:precorrin-3B synthase
MASGDGLVVRVKPRAGRLTPAQAVAVAEGARRHGNGLIDLTSRANVQIRGVSERTYDGLIEELTAAGLIDRDIPAETRRNIVVTPFGAGHHRETTLAIASALATELANAPDLPAKFGFAVDTGTERVLAGASADVRIECDAANQVLVRADGARFGRVVGRDSAAETAVRLARWFVESGGVSDGRGRMAQHLARGAKIDGDLVGDGIPSPIAAAPHPGATVDGPLVGAEFGQLQATSLAALARCCQELRLTPWRMLLLAGASEPPTVPGIVTSAGDPRMNVTACTGAPSCPQGLALTRSLARALSPFVPAGQHLHVSGCAKGCAMKGPAAYTLVATGDGFDLVRCGTAQDPPLRRALDADLIAANPALVFGAT